MTGWDRFRAPSELVHAITPAPARVTYVLGALRMCFEGGGGHLPDRVVNSASRLIVGDLSRRWALRLHVRNRRNQLEHLVLSVEPLRLDQVGYIYFAKSQLRPSTLKIGFTTRIPIVRVQSLMANSGERLELLGSFVGTLMDEQIFHFLNREAQVAGEWYFKPQHLPDLPFLAEEIAA